MSRARDLADGTFSGTVTADDILLSDADTPTLTLTDTTNTLSTFVQSGNSTAVIGTSTNHDLRFFTNNSEKARILSGGGITFNGDTAAANALDDYEEGTWTPTLAGAVSYGQQWGSYIKVGNVVSFTIFISISSGATSNTLRVSLPFASLSGADRYHAYRGWQNSWSSSGNSVQWLHSAGASEIKAYNLVSSGGVSTLTETAVGTGNFIVTGSYRTS